MGREKLMKFTPETLLQIYLDGSFTEEAQAEFDALIRKNPLFAEQVTQAVAQRLGPVSEAQIDEMAGRLDGKIGAIWSQYKPSPILRFLKLTNKIVLVLASAGVLYFGVRRIWPMIQSSINSQPSAMLALPESQPVPGNQPTKGLTLTVKSEKKMSSPSPQLASEPQSSRLKGTEVDVASHADSNGKNPSVSSLGPATRESGFGATVPSISNPGSFSSVNAQNLTSPIPSSVTNTAPPGIPAVNSGSSSTAEGDSLRVTIDMPKTQNVIVTVYDSNTLLIRHLYQGVLETGDHYVDWDGKDELGNAVLPGDYTVVLDLGNKKMSGILKILPK